jgi:hypothetical protein
MGPIRLYDECSMANEDTEEQAPELESVYAIAQEKQDSDCGPTCVTFIRYGGGLADGQGPPMEGGEIVTRDGVNDMADMMREQVKRSSAESDASHQYAGFMVDKVARAISEFAPVQDGHIYQGKFSKDWIPTEDRDLFDITVDIIRKFNEYLAFDPRGVIVPMYSTIRPPIEAYQDPESRASASAHWVTYLGWENNDARIYDPGDREIVDTYRTMTLTQLAFSHYWYCSNLQQNAVRQDFMADPQGDLDQGFTSYVIYGTKRPGSPNETPKSRTTESPYILLGDNLGEIDMKSATAWPNAQDLVAQENATYYYSYKTADKAAEALSEATSVVVIECPEGLFATVPVNDLGTTLVTGDSAVDLSSSGSSEDSYFKRKWSDGDDGMASLRLYLAYEENGERQVMKNNPLVWPDSHRKNY